MERHVMGWNAMQQWKAMHSKVRWCMHRDTINQLQWNKDQQMPGLQKTIGLTGHNVVAPKFRGFRFDLSKDAQHAGRRTAQSTATNPAAGGGMGMWTIPHETRHRCEASALSPILRWEWWSKTWPQQGLSINPTIHNFKMMTFRWALWCLLQALIQKNEGFVGEERPEPPEVSTVTNGALWCPWIFEP